MFCLYCCFACQLICWKITQLCTIQKGPVARVSKHAIKSEQDVPLVIVVSVSVCATLLLLLNVVLLSYCALARRQRKRLERRGSPTSQDTDPGANKGIEGDTIDDSRTMKKKLNLNCVTSESSESSRSCSTNSTSSSSSSSSSASEETSKTPLDAIKSSSSSSQESCQINTEGKVFDRNLGDMVIGGYLHILRCLLSLVVEIFQQITNITLISMNS